MATQVVANREAALDYVFSHMSEAFYVPPTYAFLFRGFGDQPWAQVELGDDLESRLNLAPRLDAESHGIRLIADTEEVVDAVLAAHVVTDDLAEMQGLANGTEPVECNLKQIVSLVGKERCAEIARQQLEEFCGNSELTYKVDSYDLGDARACISHADIDDWLNDVPPVPYTDLTFKHDLDGFVSYMTWRIENADWFDEERWHEEGEAAGLVAHALGKELRKLGPCLYDYVDEPVDDELLSEVREAYVWDNLMVDPNVERLIDGYGDVLVDIFLTEGDEANRDFSVVGRLSDALDNPKGYATEEVNDLLANNGLSWLAERMGVGRDAPLDARAEEGSLRRSFYGELANHPYGNLGAAVITTRLSLKDWIGMVAAKERGDNVTLWGNTFWAGIYDRWGGSGSSMDIRVEGPITLPAENIWDMALDGYERVYVRAKSSTSPHPRLSGCYELASPWHGYTIADVYGINGELWRKGRTASDLTIASHLNWLVDEGKAAFKRLEDGSGVVTTSDLTTEYLLDRRSYLLARFDGAAAASRLDNGGRVVLSPTAASELETMLEAARERAAAEKEDR